ncbi:type I secretion C-terminal target domain-containing protein [Parendozoicomonas sp. Alg238-R29]|uniref:type I secretion C-terminal target domain-containing protein n=1 Tax=Parendozoicomonas sp. Alg238-R29 TaxID=2993446 RepID=UPI00248D7E00|nr:type I secretion C-terminal target domain-containing protein [Parendozoicomonas sp. Alg238-R29]
MSQQSSSDAAVVVSLEGAAFIETADGNLVPLEPGATLAPGETVRTVDGSQIQVRMANGELTTVGSNSTFQAPYSFYEPSSENEIAPGNSEEPAEIEDVPHEYSDGESHSTSPQPPGEVNSGGGTLELQGSGSTPMLSPAVNFLTPVEIFPDETTAAQPQGMKSTPLSGDFSASASRSVSGRAVDQQNDNQTDAPAEDPAEVPAEVPAEDLAEVPTEVPTEVPAEAPVQTAPDSALPPEPEFTVEGQTLNVALDENTATVSTETLGLISDVANAGSDNVIVTSINGAAVGATGITNIAGDYGTLMVSADGTYSYTPFNSSTEGETETFTYVVSDGSNTTTAELTVNVLEDSFTSSDTATVYESEGPDDSILVYDSEGSRLLVVDTETGASRTLFSGNPVFHDVAVGSNNHVYGIADGQIYSIDIFSGTASSVVNHGVSTQIEGMTMSPDGTVYVVDSAGVISTVSLTDGTTTAIGSVGGTPVGGITWHDGAIYTVLHQSGPSQDWLTKIDLTSNMVTPLAQVDVPYTALASRNGELVGVDADGQTFEVDPNTGAATELATSIGESVSGASQFAFGQASGNIVTNDIGAISITQVTGENGQNIQINSDGITVIQGAFGDLHISADGSYTYHLDNSNEEFENLDLGETANDRFVYTATNTGGDTAQSVLTLFINGATDIATANPPVFTETQGAYAFGDSSAQPLSFVVDAGTNQRITGLTISGHGDGTLSSPSQLTDNGSVTSGSNSWSWSATSGNNAGLESLDASSAGLTLGGINNSAADTLHVEVTVTQYNDDGTAASSWTSTVPLDARLIHLDQQLIGDVNNDILTGGSTDDGITGGSGNDTLTGGAGADVFIWESEHVGTAITPSVDTITDFTLGQQGDVLNITDLIPESASQNELDQYLSFNFEDGNTTISVSDSANGEAVQQIVLENIDLSASVGSTDTSALINNLTDNGNLMI